MRLSELIPTKSTVELCFYGDFYVTLRHTDEALLKEMRKRASAPHNKRRRSDELDEEAIINAYAELVFIDFRGLYHDTKSSQGNLEPIQNTLEFRKKLLHANIDFRSWIIQEAGNVQNFVLEHPEEVEEDQKKLNAGSPSE